MQRLERVAQVADELVLRAIKSGLFYFADTDLKFDQPQAEVVFDRDKVRSLGVDLSRAGQEMRSARLVLRKWKMPPLVLTLTRSLL